MAPRAPIVWTTAGVGGERFRRRLDQRHRELSVQAKLDGRTYRRSRARPGTDEDARIRGDFLASLGRLSSFEAASARLGRCRYEFQLAAHADDLSRDYFELWQVVARRGAEQHALDERDAERLDYFATRLGRLEGLADALTLAGRNVRLFPVPTFAWAAVG